MSTRLSPDGRAVVEAVDRLTTQVKRLADAQSTPVAVIRDGVMTPLDAPTTTAVCNEPGPWGDAHACVRPAGHDGDHEGHDGCGWRDSVPDGDEGALRTARRDSLLVLLSRAGRMRLSMDEAALLRQHVETEMRDADTARAVAAGNKRHVQLLYADLQQAQAELEQAQAAINRVRKLASRWAVLRAYGSAATELRRALDGTEQPTGCPCHTINERCSGCGRCPDVCHGCDGAEQPTTEA